ncbi:MAG TPA: VOC family protein [Candidatus Kapabacteria bacterium]|nr:VOC family protein [Candidatus Kapabacteria bacterium]
MKAQIRFFEIPSENYQRAIKFYQNVFGFEIKSCEYETEKMAMIEGNPVPGCIFYAEGYKPSNDGVIISFEVEDINVILEKAKRNGSKVVMEKCQIQAENMGYCAYFIDSEGNKIGLHSK